MNKHCDHDTREHLLITGEQRCLLKGFNAMGLSDLLKTADVPKGSFYHYFPSKEAFGVSMLEHHYAGYNHGLEQHFASAAGNYRDRLLAYFSASLQQFRDNGNISSCLTVKLSAEVCDLSEPMRSTLETGTSQVIGLLAKAIESARREGSLEPGGDALHLAQVLYALWLGANLQAKITRHARPLESTLEHVQQILAVPSR